MKSIDTLIPDIYSLFTEGHEFDKGHVEAFGKRLAEIIRDRLGRSKDMPTLRMSNIGTPCLRKLWYEINKPEAGEDFGGPALLKFLYGDILEALIIFLAKEAGHEVTGEQDTLDIAGVKGHRDGIIDGTLVDVKSASSFSFKKFSEGTLSGDDAFGYLDQINTYLYASQDDPLLKDKASAAFIAIDKTLGKMAILKVQSNGKDYEKEVQKIRAVLSDTNPPPRGFKDVPMGKSGNRKLGVNCSYCAFKFECWPGLEVYDYSYGPEFLTHVAKPPRVEKVEKF